jgi:hypothetical protein
MKAQEQKKPDLKTAEARPATFNFQFERSEPIHLAACEAERRSWREGCLRTGALTARTSARCGSAVSVTVKQRDSTQCHIV